MSTHGKRLCEMPEDLFPQVEETDYSNSILLSSNLLNISRLEDCGYIPTAYSKMKEICSHEQQLPKILLYDIKAEYLLLALLMGNITEAETIYDSKLERYMKATAGFSAGEIPIFYTWELFVRHDEKKVQSFKSKLQNNADKYINLGEVRMSMALVEFIDRQWIVKHKA